MCIKSDFKEIFLKLVANDRSDKQFLLTWKIVPWGLSAPDPWLYTFIKSWKDVYKIRGWRDFLETCNKWPKWWGLPVDIKILAPLGCLPILGLYVINHDKMCIKSESKDVFLKYATSDQSDKTFLIPSKKLSPRVVSPCPCTFMK